MQDMGYFRLKIWGSGDDAIIVGSQKDINACSGLGETSSLSLPGHESLMKLE